MRLRVESCVDVILALDERLGEGKIQPEIIRQFQRLKEHLHFVDDELVDEKDINRIETATNQLMAEIGAALGKDHIGSLFEGRMH
jgi:trimethylamine:corrinoid methyltransferase-like protein